ncbi:hypothetical protein V8G54_037068 [Vigna mungo]|uniref:Uncharacterized protein n=1 Tax=Vigna mungo TaxID=3915 RepID=A0AAQ3MHW7_VIGMU
MEELSERRCRCLENEYCVVMHEKNVTVMSGKSLVSEHETLTLPFQSCPRESENMMEHRMEARVRGKGNAKKAFAVEVRVSIEATEEGLENNGSMRGKNKSSRGKKRGFMAR